MTSKNSFDFFGEYQLLEEIYNGAMSILYRAYDSSQNRIVALKILKKEFSSESELVERFVREAKIAKGLTHPNIIKIYEIGSKEDNYYFTMEFINGPSLRKLLQNEKILEVGKALRIAKMACLGLHYAHCAQVIHRDIKPSNIMLDEKGNVILLDFGIAKILYLARLTRPGFLLGTPEYMSPEQIKGTPLLDGRTDVYSLGIVLYELLTGTLPFKGENFLEIAEKVVKKVPPKPSEFNKEIPKEVDQLILKAIEKDRRNRFTTALEMANAINQVLGLPREEIKDFKKPLLLEEKSESGKPVLASASQKKDFSLIKKPTPFFAVREYLLPPIVAGVISLLLLFFLNFTFFTFLIPYILILVAVCLFLFVLGTFQDRKPKRYSTAWLLLISGNEVFQKFFLNTNTLIIGRDQPEGIELFKETVSRSHAQIKNEDGFFVIYDMNSTNGTFVNGKRISRHILKKGDIINIGGEILIFEGSEETGGKYA